MTGPGYPATPLLRRLTAANGWQHDLARDARGEPVAVVAVRIGPVWTDSVAITGESETLAMRHRTNDDRLILPTELPSGSRAVWRRAAAPDPDQLGPVPGGQSRARPSSCARIAACTRERRSSLDSTRDTCVFTVASEM